jgi:uncharacterized membrane protein (DUF2068 family)
MPGTLTKTRPAAGKQESATTLFLIALFKLFKGVMLLIVAIGALRLLHKDVSVVVQHWIDLLRADPDNRFIHRILVKSFGIQAKQLKEISAGTFFYSGILLTEGIGLLMKKHWAEYFTVISTAVFIPLEVYEIFQRFTWVRVGVLIVNVAIVWYLVDRIRKRR